MTRVEVSLTKAESELLREITRLGPSKSQALRMIVKAGFAAYRFGDYEALKPARKFAA